MRIPLYQVDAFTNEVFAGNPAAVCPLERWLSDATLQAIATENNLSETAFLVPHGTTDTPGYELRWFTPTLEVDLCGHATLASAMIVFDRLDPGHEEVCFHTRSGLLGVKRTKDLLELDFPSQPGTPCEPPAGLVDALGGSPREVLKNVHYYLVAYESEADVRALEPQEAGLLALDKIGVIVTAPGDDVDFVSRFFAPAAGVMEDPVTGSAHCALTPYWAARLERKRLRARQISRRGGELYCELRDDRVAIAGQAVLYLEGEIHI